jgi:NADH-quinone oxidoreductase subunit M
MLAWTIYISFAGALLLLLLPEAKANAARMVALATAAAGLALALTAFLQHRSGALETIVDVRWVPSLGLAYHLAADGVSLCLVLLTGVVAVTGILFSWNIAHRAREFFAFYLLLIGAVYGVFLSYDLLLLFTF